VNDAVEAVRQADQLPEPRHHALLELRCRRARLPQHPVDAQAGRQHLAQDGRAAVVGREIGEEARVVPVRDAGHDVALEVRQDARHGLAFLGRGVGQRVQQVPGSAAAAHGVAVGMFEIVGDPVDHFVRVSAELLGFHACSGRRVG